MDGRLTVKVSGLHAEVVTASEIAGRPYQPRDGGIQVVWSQYREGPHELWLADIQ